MYNVVNSNCRDFWLLTVQKNKTGAPFIRNKRPVVHSGRLRRRPEEGTRSRSAPVRARHAPPVNVRFGMGSVSHSHDDCLRPRR